MLTNVIMECYWCLCIQKYKCVCSYVNKTIHFTSVSETTSTPSALGECSGVKGEYGGEGLLQSSSWEDGVPSLPSTSLLLVTKLNSKNVDKTKGKQKTLPGKLMTSTNVIP